MTLTFSEWSSQLPSGSITVDAQGNATINCTAVNGGAIPTSIVPVLFELLDGLGKYQDVVNQQRAAALPSQTALTLISKTIAQYSDSSGTSNISNPELITNTWTVAIDEDTSTLGPKAIDPSV